jgi:acyl-CoA synthetase (AMP-forming)/AMP-acid ligase II
VRTTAILADCRPALILIPERWRDALTQRLGFEAEKIGAMESFAVTIDLTPTNGENIDLHTTAHLQYTSGTGGTAKGVRVSYANLAHNIAVHQAAVPQPPDQIMLSWLPQYHDMQLVGIICRTLAMGGHCVLMSPIDFLQRPVRWLRAVTAHRAYLSGGPNFAYETCLQRIGSDEIETLDLSHWRIAFNSSERIRPRTVQAFAERFAPGRFDAKSFYAAYGLAEATALVTGTVVGQGIQFRDHPAVSQPVACCGKPTLDDQVRIVDPSSGQALAPDVVGEIHVAGKAVTAGYWTQTGSAFALFRDTLPIETKPGPWLRTGDLGFLDLAGSLHVTGRVKDLIIIRGNNHLPEDIEASVHAAHPSLRPGEIAAFAFEFEVDNHEHLAIAAELERGDRHHPDVEAIVEAVQIALSRDHGLALDHLFLLLPGGLPKTTSGKIQRSRCRELVSAGNLSTVATWHRNIPTSVR